MRFVSFSLRLVWALVVLVAVCVAWLVLFLVSLPFLVIAAFVDRKPNPEETETVTSAPETDSAVPLIFDRRSDVSKLFGCNTRNVRYRWNLFASKLDQIRARARANDSTPPQALDFGAGSLRDSYELARLGFCVTSVDLDPEVMQRYYRSYDWNAVRCPPKVFTKPLETLKEEPGQSGFHLAIAFDVIEHLEDPSHYCRCIHTLLNDGGLFFSIVPNRRSLFERYFKHAITKRRAQGIPWVPGVPHLQFKTPSEWEDLFKQSGFKILEHDMAIGFFVNDWTALVGLPLRVYVTPVLARLAAMLRMKFNETAFEETFSPPWLMKRIDVLDQLCKKQFAQRFGWNLIVATK
jgi:2-polyprenyl-3-methyl-5-hydroxy-6-metoxy-1,4-benzoquinol methylase